MGPLIGVVLHAIGGFAAGSFYMPLKKVRHWSWETYWLVCGVFAWIITPWVMLFLVVPHSIEVLTSASGKALFLAYFFGLLWGIGGLMYGLTMRYLGMSLGVALALGCCAVVGTLEPAIRNGTLVEMVKETAGLVTLSGVVLCVVGIVVCGIAGMFKEGELSEAEKTETIEEFSFVKGVLVAIVAGIMSACFAIGLDHGAPIAERAAALGTASFLVNTPIFILIMGGGFTTNLVWCLLLAIRNKSLGDYGRGRGASLSANYLFSALGGITWYGQFLFYGMGATQMGRFGFASWTLHMAFIILFGNMWGLVLHEWRGSSRRTYRFVFAGMALLIFSTVVIGIGNKIAG